ncbi:Pentatricopeptide repeat-containing protein [Nymphaea thermarum]|nr:Pentatricopeptide repeat-containing protein [Nymphaea thermarum]
MKKKRRRPNSGFLGVQDTRRPLFVIDLMGEGESSALPSLVCQGMRLLGEVVGTDRQLFVDLIQAGEGCNWNPVVFDMLIKVYVQFGRVQAGMEVFRRMIGIGLLPQVSACNSLLNGLLKSTFDES